MELFKYVMLAIGLMFVVFGVQIFFFKNYSRINGFEADLKNGKYDESFAKRLGLIELISGVLFLIFGGLGFILPDTVSLYAFIGIILLTLIAIVLNSILSKKHSDNFPPRVE